MLIGIGIDTGGTYTDAVAYDFEARAVVAKAKARTTREDLSVGIGAALDALPAELVQASRLLSLSTTLATNACVERKGGRAKLVLLGTSRKILEWIDAKNVYGLDAGDVLCLHTHSSFDGTVVDHPDWERVAGEEDAWFADAQALAVAEVNGSRNGGVCEALGQKFLQERYGRAGHYGNGAVRRTECHGAGRYGTAECKAAAGDPGFYGGGGAGGPEPGDRSPADDRAQ